MDDSQDASPAAISAVIEARTRDLGGFSVGRVLPAAGNRMVGPFIFFDHIGPAVQPPGEGVTVRPHPHIHLATVTYLFDGELVHRDSLGTHQTIRPGAINWMTAGRGIVHSERTAPERQAAAAGIHGVQMWVALPSEHEDTEPSFQHHSGDTLPSDERDGVTIRVLAGAAFGMESPVATLSPLFCADVHLPAGSELSVPDSYSERAAYIVEGTVVCAGQREPFGRMLRFASARPITLRAESDTRLVLIGGEPVGERHIWWNFISSSKERIEQAKRDWQEGRFPKVPGDEDEFIPLPE
ncbi:pirin family protein [Haliangium ochraceum]|uniref:Pirin domain protein n=1 Tax=Haliangium ochraceum (strain DSM 14365 / JCM 11303 / SMP-2) TaxID=502025 RepID=D0LXZ8_HALO1|nr:pirin family protein [Haliangium ochraceum]ACY14353.1 Pirin domain protein [Haliangium ochraceum DSM 14365]